jgi:hypothetical protein
MVLNKKGVFFTTLVIVMLSLFFVSFIVLGNVRDSDSLQNRVETMNNFVNSIEKDIPRKLKISTFRIVFLFEKEIIESGSYISDINSSFSEAFFNGTINGQTSPEIVALMTGATFPDMLADFNEKASKVSANINMFSPSIEISQDSPWQVKIVLTATLSIEDLSNLATWNRTSSTISYVSIENFEDPLYFINTNGLVANKVIKAPNETFVLGSDVSTLLAHSQNSYYINSSEAPSFLDRLQGINTANPQGIESLVNLAELSAQGISISDKTVVDHIYFSTSNPSDCNVQPTGMPSWFKLDDSHLGVYQVSCQS